jgi:DNA-binding LacI/PurR family transcriptional regulator
MIEVDHSCQSGLEMMEKLLSVNPRPTALISTDSVTAIGALRWLYRQGIRVPDDFSVIGFDHGQIGGMAVPALTTIEIDHVALAKAAVGALRQPPKSDSTAGRRPSQKIATQLIVRESTSFPAGTMISVAATALEKRIGEFA